MNRNPISKNTRHRVLNREGAECALCGKQLFLKLDADSPNDARYVQIDHKVPLYVGGEDSVENMRVVCRSCNSKRHGSLGKDFIKHHERQMTDALYRMKERYKFYNDSIELGLFTQEDLKVAREMWAERVRMEQELFEMLDASIKKTSREERSTTQ